VNSDAQHILLAWNKISTPMLAAYNLYRQEGPSGAAVRIASVKADSLSSYLDTFDDVNPNLFSYRYFIRAVDSCNVESPPSIQQESILLQVGIDSASNVPNLRWNHNTGIMISGYSVIKEDSIGQSQIIASLPATANSFIPPASNVRSDRYKVAAWLTDTCYLSDGTSVFSATSNEVFGYFPLGQNTIIEHFIFNVKPNPAVELIEIPNGFAGKSAKIYSVLGQLLISEEIKQDNFIDISSLPAGSYLIRIDTHSARFVKQ
jgi:hypothetical protein